MIQLLKREQVDDNLWNACIENACIYSVSAYTWYLDIVCPGWMALVQDDYVAVLPLPIKSRFKVHYCMQPLFVKTLSIYSHQKITSSLISAFFNAIPENVKYTDINFMQEDIVIPDLFKAKKKQYQCLDISNSYEVIYSAYHQNVKRTLKKTAQLALSVVNDITIEQVIAMFKKNAGYKVNALKAKHYKQLHFLMSKLLSCNKGILLAVKDHNSQVVASAFFIRTHKYISFFTGSSTPHGKVIGAMTFLFNQVIKQYSGNNLTFDFEGSAIKSIADFNKKFGAQDVTYLQLKKNSLPLLLKKLKE